MKIIIEITHIEEEAAKEHLQRRSLSVSALGDRLTVADFLLAKILDAVKKAREA